MRYMGSKARIAKQIKGVILSHVPSTSVTYWEPFAGGMNSFREIAPEFQTSVATDAHEDLMLFWREFLLGDFDPPRQVSEKEYAALRHAEPSPLRGFVGFGCSFGGKWFGGYARGGFNSDGSPRIHSGESYRAVHRTKKRLQGANILRIDSTPFYEIQPAKGDVVYCDPPYANSTGYKEGFDHDSFWGWAKDLNDRGAFVFVSEYSAPPGWGEVWSAPLRKSVSVASDREVAIERLFKVL